MNNKENSNSYKWRSTKGEKLLNNLNFDPKILTNSGIKVRSRNEKKIANYLKSKNITFIYEHRLKLKNRTYYPDFFLPDYNLYIEFFGWAHIPSYQKRMENKILFYSENNIRCIYLYLKGSKYIEKKLEEELIKYNVLEELNMEIQKAEEIVTSLANGIDPITSEVFPDDSPYNHPMVIRSLLTIVSNVRFPKKEGKQTIEEKQAQNLADGKPKNAGMIWTEELKQEVSKLFEDGKAISELAEYFERTEGAIRSELIHQGLIE